MLTKRPAKKQELPKQIKSPVIQSAGFVKNIKISEARKHIKDLVHEVSMTGKPVVLSHRDTPEVIVIPYGINKSTVLNQPEYTPYSEFMAVMFTKKFLVGASMSIFEAQVREFAQLPTQKLTAFLEIESLPMSVEQRTKLKKAVGDKIVERLEKRREIVDDIRKAEEEGLYDAEEHKTGMMRL